MTTTGPLFETLRDVLRASPTAGRLEQAEAFWLAVKRDSESLRLLADAYFYFNVNKFDVRLGKHATTVTPVPPVPREKTLKESRERIQKEYEGMKSRLASVILMDLVMPNGKALRYCKLGECAKFGGFFTELSKHGKATQAVDKVYQERDLKAMRDRYMAAQPTASKTRGANVTSLHVS